MGACSERMRVSMFDWQMWAAGWRHTRARTHTHTRTHTHACTHAHTHTHTHARTHIRMHARTHARTHIHKHTHTHTCICAHKAHTSCQFTAQKASPTFQHRLRCFPPLVLVNLVNLNLMLISCWVSKRCLNPVHMHYFTNVVVVVMLNIGNTINAALSSQFSCSSCLSKPWSASWKLDNSASTKWQRSLDVIVQIWTPRTLFKLFESIYSDLVQILNTLLQTITSQNYTLPAISLWHLPYTCSIQYVHLPTAFRLQHSSNSSLNYLCPASSTHYIYIHRSILKYLDSACAQTFMITGTLSPATTRKTEWPANGVSHATSNSWTIYARYMLGCCVRLSATTGLCWNHNNITRWPMPEVILHYVQQSCFHKNDWGCSQKRPTKTSYFVSYKNVREAALALP